MFTALCGLLETSYDWVSCSSFIMTACSRDGTVRLWDCGEAKCLSVVSKSDCPVNSCALSEFCGMDNTSDNQTSKILCTALIIQEPL